MYTYPCCIYIPHFIIPLQDGQQRIYVGPNHPPGQWVDFEAVRLESLAAVPVGLEPVYQEWNVTYIISAPITFEFKFFCCVFRKLGPHLIWRQMLYAQIHRMFIARITGDPSLLIFAPMGIGLQLTDWLVQCILE